MLFPQIEYFTRGVADHVPVNCLEPFPQVRAWIARMVALPPIKAYYAKLGVEVKA